MAQRWIDAKWLKTIGTVETLLGAAHLFTKRNYTHSEKVVTIDAGPDFTSVRSKDPVRLIGFVNQHHQGALGTVLVLHGWEGSSHTPDSLSIGELLFRQGYDTVRLNFRDHGRTHALNEGLFSGALIHEVAHAAQFAAGLNPRKPFYVTGCSLGGNFAIRLGLADCPVNIENLERVAAVCPALDPYAATLAIDSHVIFRTYFCSRWRRSLRYKQKLFPDRYQFKSFKNFRSVESITQELHREHFPFKTIQEYYETYTITPQKLCTATIPIEIIATKSDPVIPFDNFKGLSELNNINFVETLHGGHIGFLNAKTLSRNLAAVAADLVLGRSLTV